MLLYKYVPESDRDIIPSVSMTFEEAEDLDLYEHVDNFKYFLRALSFPDSLVDKIKVDDLDPKSDSKAEDRIPGVALEGELRTHG